MRAFWRGKKHVIQQDKRRTCGYSFARRLGYLPKNKNYENA